MNLVLVFIWIVLVMLAVGLAAILLFGIKAMVEGKIRMSALIAAVLTLLVFGIAYLTSLGSPDVMVMAFVRTVLILFAIGMLSILMTGFRRLVI